MNSKKTLLVVDDNRINRQILRKILSNEYNIIEAENGQDALDILHNSYNSISVVLLDIIMPVMNGYDVLVQMHKDAFLSKIPVIIASGQNTEDAEIRALSLGANDYIIKPYKPEIIRHRIANTIYLKETSSFFNSVQRDALTGLFGKDYFYMQVSKTLRNNPKKQYDLVCLDIERFKLVNDIYGIQVGDNLLKYLAQVLLDTIGDNGFCGRIGADEFVCLIPHRTDYVKEMFTKSIERVNEFSDTIKLNFVLRYGIYFIEDSSTPINIMCDRAMLAKESVKGKYDTYFAYYDDTIRQRLLEEQMLVSDMKMALAQHQFQVFFQPKYDLKTNEIVGAEALVRWLHPVKGFLPPNTFIPLFEKNGFITNLDYYIWEQCCQKMKAWRDKGNPLTPISINVSRVDIYDSELPEKLLALIQKYELSPRYLHLEITESAYTEDSEQLIDVVSRLKRIGFSIEMDDFGTGYSSLNMLSELPIDILKLDMRFIQKHEKKGGERNVLSFVISLAKWMNLKVVAEGIETLEQVQTLQSLGCEYAQGYYYAKPMPQDQFEQHLMTATLSKEDSHSLREHIEDTELSNRKVLLVFDPNGIDAARMEQEFISICRVERADTLAEARMLLEKLGKNLSALVISLPTTLEIDAAAELIKHCRANAVPTVVMYDANSAPDEALQKLDISDFIARGYEVWQVRLRLKNAIAYAKMEEFEREKEINATIIEMRKRAEHDALTGLLNRAEYEVRLDHFFLNNMEPVGIFIILDVDNFKTVNDNYGHVIGDQVLAAVGDHIQDIFPETEIIARIGGDEFSLFIPYSLPNTLLQSKMDQLCSKITLPIQGITITCSAGLCHCPDYGINHKDLYKNADTALIVAKRNGKSQYEIFQSGMEIPTPSVLQEKTMLMLDHVSDAMFVCDAVTSEIIYINETACSILKKGRNECLGQRCYQLFWDRCRHCERCAVIDIHKQDFYEEATLLNDQKTPVYIKARVEQWENRSVKVHYLQISSPDATHTGQAAPMDSPSIR